MRGIVSAAGYLPFRRLQRADITATFGTGGGKGTRTVASYDEDTTTMGVEAARLALRSAGAPAVDALWFATADPAYLDKTNATAIHAALRLDGDTSALDLGGAMRSGIGALRIALEGAGIHAGGQRRHPHRPADQPRRVGRRRRRRGGARRRRRRPGDRRVPRRRRGDRRVPRPLAHPGRPALPRVGGAVRRDEVRAPR